MDFFDVLTLIGGLSLFLFGMNIMGQSLERVAGEKLRLLLGKLTTNKTAGLMTGMGITAVIQSSSATTVMVVGFTNSGLMTLRQAINVIMGANIGTTVTAWILSLAGIGSDNIWVRLFKPSSFTPILAMLGIIFYVFCKSSRKKDIGLILLGFSTLMFGMETMSGAVSGLRNVPEFTNILIYFKNPVLGVVAGAVLTAVIQSSSASVGILQALGSTGAVSYGAAVPIIMGQNIGTCVTALLSSVGANKIAKRTAMVHLCFNTMGTVACLVLYCLLKSFITIPILDSSASYLGIALVHSGFNVFCTVLILPLTSVLEKMVNTLVPDAKGPEQTSLLDERLLNTPSIALERCHIISSEMAEDAISCFKEAMSGIGDYNAQCAESVREKEARTDKLEDVLGTYLVNLSSRQISERDSMEAAKLLKIIGDFERIADHAVNIIRSVEELRQKSLSFTAEAKKEISVLSKAVNETVDITLKAFLDNDLNIALKVEPLEHVVDLLKEQLRTNHITRLQKGSCSIDVGFVWSDLLTNIERVSDHCSNIAGCIIDIAGSNMNLHESLRRYRHDSDEYRKMLVRYESKYSLDKPVNSEAVMQNV